MPKRDQIVTAKLVAAVPGVHDVPELQEHVGRWLTEYKPEQAEIGRQWLWTTDVREEALRLPFVQMITLLKRHIGIRAHDGKPDRPISIYHIQIDHPRDTEEEEGDAERRHQ